MNTVAASMKGAVFRSGTSLLRAWDGLVTPCQGQNMSGIPQVWHERFLVHAFTPTLSKEYLGIGGN